MPALASPHATVHDSRPLPQMSGSRSLAFRAVSVCQRGTFRHGSGISDTGISGQSRQATVERYRFVIRPWPFRDPCRDAGHKALTLRGPWRISRVHRIALYSRDTRDTAQPAPSQVQSDEAHTRGAGVLASQWSAKPSQATRTAQARQDGQPRVHKPPSTQDSPHRTVRNGACIVGRSVRGGPNPLKKEGGMEIFGHPTVSREFLSPSTVRCRRSFGWQPQCFRAWWRCRGVGSC